MYVVLLLFLATATSATSATTTSAATMMTMTSCDGGAGWQNVSCPTSSSTCCPYHWSENEYGCCPLPNAVCCGGSAADGGYQCCPAGTTCKVISGAGTFSVHNECVKQEVPVQPAEGICKIGPQFPSDPTKPNILVMSDSVGIGWTPFVAQALADEAFVQHTPWSGDGGSSCTQYSLRCLDRFLSSPSGQELGDVDIFLFNSGMHNLLEFGPGNPGQTGNTSVYGPELAEITARLKAWAEPRGTKLLFSLTTPFLCNVTTNDIVNTKLNPAAVAIMSDAGIPVLDNYSPIIQRCGTPPVTQCFGKADCWCPHCPDCGGYPWLANTTIVPRLRQMLKQLNQV